MFVGYGIVSEENGSNQAGRVGQQVMTDGWLVDSAD
jgi:hypothetical protein